MSDRRIRDRLRDIMNGDWDDLDPNSRRMGVILSDEIDGIHERLRQSEKNCDERWREVQSSIDEIRNRLVVAFGSLVTILMGAAITVFFTR